MKEKVNELLNDFKGRIKNPLITSFILIWAYYHWKILFWIFPSNNISVSERITLIESHINMNGFYGMILMPLWKACFALPVYFLLANLSQIIFIWLGKRLNLFILSKFDKGKLVLRKDYENLEVKYDTLKSDYNVIKSELHQLTSDYRHQSESLNDKISENEKLRAQLTELRSNVFNDTGFQDHFIYTLCFLLAKYKNLNPKSIRLPNINNFDIRLLKGSWDIQKYESGPGSTYTTQTLNFQNETVTTINNTDYGHINKFFIDKSTSISELEITIPVTISTTKTDTFILFKFSDKLFIGYKNDIFVKMIKN